MRQILAIILMCSLMGSWSTAVIASYCEHEEVAAANKIHFGHHADNCGDGQEQNGSQPSGHTHCSLSQLYSSVVIPNMATFSTGLHLHVLPFSKEIFHLDSVVLKKPERPKWLAYA